MSAAKRAKELGMKSLTEVTELTGRKPSTLASWYAFQPEFFDIVVMGCKLKRDNLKLMGGRNDIGN